MPKDRKACWRLTDEQWSLTTDLFPTPKPGRQGGQPRVESRICFEAILWVLCSTAARPTAVDKHRKVAEFLRDLMCRRDQPGGDTKPDIDEKTRSNEEASDEIVQGIGNQDQERQRLVLLRGRLMAVVPIKKLFQRQEQQKSSYDPCIDRRLVTHFRDCGGDHVEDRAADQRTCREGDHGQESFVECLCAEHKRDCAD